MRDKPDASAKEIIPNLEKAGWSCCRIAKAKQRERGIPDTVVARKGSQLNHLLEMKSLGGRMTPEQIEFAKNWPGCVHVATSSWEADLLLKECEESRISTRLPKPNYGAEQGTTRPDRPAFSPKEK